MTEKGVTAMSKKNMVKQKLIPKQRGKKALKILLIIILITAILAGCIAVINTVGNASNRNFINDSVKTVEYTEQLEPTLEDDGSYTFVTDRDFKAVQLTDVHIGAGFMSIKKDNMALNAVTAMLTQEKPDLVIVTGDIAYPVPFQAGTFNNKSSAILFAELMEKLGIYWCLGFGNHDTESYSFFSREDISKLYSDHKKYPHCLFTEGPEDVDGCGNYVINIKNTKGKITQSLFVFDSHSYTDNDVFGIMWKYDCVHENQVQWYRDKIANLTEQNSGEVPKSMAFMHIPVVEMREAYYEYRDNGFADTEDVKYLYGTAGEKSDVVYSSDKNCGLFDAFLEEGSTQNVFFGHDHLNNFSLIYKGIRFTYGYSIDYLAYSGISKFGAQRGCNIIMIHPDGSYDCTLENYYQDKYQSVNAKEKVDMGKFYKDAE